MCQSGSSNDGSLIFWRGYFDNLSRPSALSLQHPRLLSFPPISRAKLKLQIPLQVMHLYSTDWGYFNSHFWDPRTKWLQLITPVYVLLRDMYHTMTRRRPCKTIWEVPATGKDEVLASWGLALSAGFPFSVPLFTFESLIGKLAHLYLLSLALSWIVVPRRVRDFPDDEEIGLLFSTPANVCTVSLRHRLERC
jgi:hypothetical protein